MTKKITHSRQWPVIEDLPKEEQKPFYNWLIGKTIPVNNDGSHGYYQIDYDRWKHYCWSNPEYRSQKNKQWPVITELPGDEQQPFLEWLKGQTVPVNEDGSQGYYPWDYERWKKGLSELLAPKRRASSTRQLPQ